MDDFRGREMLAMGAMMVALVWLGLYPQPVLDLAQPVLDSLHGWCADATSRWRGRSAMTAADFQALRPCWCWPLAPPC